MRSFTYQALPMRVAALGLTRVLAEARMHVPVDVASRGSSASVSPTRTPTRGR